MPSPSVSVSAATASAGTSVAGSSTGAGSGASSGAGTGAGARSTGASPASAEGGAITVIPDPGVMSPQVIVQSPAFAPGLPRDGDVTQVLSTLPTMTGTSLSWAEATPRPATSPTPKVAMVMNLFMGDPPVGDMVDGHTLNVSLHRQQVSTFSIQCNGWITERVSFSL